MRFVRVAAVAAVVAVAGGAYALGVSQGGGGGTARADDDDRGGGSLWSVYQSTLRRARYIDLTHTVTPHSPVWKGFGPSRFKPAVNPDTGQPYRYAADGFEATA
ncbi:MAG TPA: hypothetical protein VGJ70_26170, partial [Solirubrobacteraceae bacterium]